MKIAIELEEREVIALSTAMSFYVGAIKGKIRVTHYDEILKVSLEALDEVVKMQYNENPNALIPLIEKLRDATFTADSIKSKIKDN